MTFNPRELATVLAALRYWQRDWEGEIKMAKFEKREPAVMIADHFEDFEDPRERLKPLSPEEIGALCERINTAEEPLVIVSGGAVQNYEQGCGFDLLDYDNLKSEGAYPPTEWQNLSEQAKRYVRQHDPEIAAHFEPPARKAKKAKKARRQR